MESSVENEQRNLQLSEISNMDNLTYITGIIRDVFLSFGNMKISNLTFGIQQTSEDFFSVYFKSFIQLSVQESDGTFYRA